MKGLPSEMDRINFEFEETEIEVVALQSHELIIVDGIHFQLKKGATTKVPYWVARELIDMGVAELPNKAFVSVPVLHSLFENEEAVENALLDVNRFLFRRVREEIKRLESQRSGSAIQLKTKLEGIFQQFLQIRLRKILKNAGKTSPDKTSTVRNMTEEERWLFTELTSLVIEWKEKLGMKSPAYEDISDDFEIIE